ncbi:MAG: DegT/DnrJ/EryC1/StrS family aminotransferase [Ignavibacteria bacterium]|nr:DegT/DnrJ/EryC1/StrS family aminotransferase [Ignavibacteria bacterium]
MKVPLLDLKAQFNTIREEIKNKLNEVIESQYFILGKEVQDLEKKIAEYVGTKYAVGVSSGTDALLISLMAIDLKPGDEVILPSYSFFATAGVVARMNAIPVFADINPYTFNINPLDIEKRITEKTRAIIPVHLYGQSCEMNEIINIAKKYNLKIIEDAAQAIGTQYKNGVKVGALGDIGCFSFFPSKNLGCFGDGGIVTTNNDELSEKLKILRVHGSKPKYYHKIIGGNFRLDEIQAAVLNVKFPYLDKWSAKRRENAELYTRLFIEAGLSEQEGKLIYDEKNTVLLPKAMYKGYKDSNGNEITNYHIYNQYVIRIQERDALKKYLAENEIGTEIYYPVPFHRQECFRYLNCDLNSYPISDDSANSSLALPIYPELSYEQIHYVVQKISDFYFKN